MTTNTHSYDQVEKDFSLRAPIRNEVDPVIATRYSPRAFKRAALRPEDIEVLFDAARQAPSCFNEQPWKFYTSNNDSFDYFLSFLVPDNINWANSASVISVLTARKTFEKNGEPNDYHFFDCGAAWFALTYQARKMGFYTHAMAGINKDKIIEELKVPETHDVVCAIAIGVIDKAAAKDEEITPRKTLDEILEVL